MILYSLCLPLWSFDAASGSFVGLNLLSLAWQISLDWPYLVSSDLSLWGNQTEVWHTLHTFRLCLRGTLAWSYWSFSMPSSWLLAALSDCTRDSSSWFACSSFAPYRECSDCQPLSAFLKQSTLEWRRRDTCPVCETSDCFESLLAILKLGLSWPVTVSLHLLTWRSKREAIWIRQHLRRLILAWE